MVRLVSQSTKYYSWHKSKYIYTYKTAFFRPGVVFGGDNINSVRYADDLHSNKSGGTTADGRYSGC